MYRPALLHPTTLRPATQALRSPKVRAPQTNTTEVAKATLRRDTLNSKAILSNQAILSSKATPNRATTANRTRCTTHRNSRVILLSQATSRVIAGTAEVPAPVVSALVSWLRSHAAAVWTSSSKIASVFVRTGQFCLRRDATDANMRQMTGYPIGKMAHSGALG